MKLILDEWFDEVLQIVMTARLIQTMDCSNGACIQLLWVHGLVTGRVEESQLGIIHLMIRRWLEEKKKLRR